VQEPQLFVYFYVLFIIIKQNEILSKEKDMGNKKDDLGDRMKMYEHAGSGDRLLPLLPAMVRVDGKGFSKFTKGLHRPYDIRMSELMVDVTKYLVKETGALMGYTQSDEISLVLYSSDIRSQIYFDGRVQKMVGDIAVMTSLEFNRLLADRIPEKGHLLPRFDCRVWNVPSLEEAANTILWRELDASKNSISMAAHDTFSHKSLQGKNGKEQKAMLLEEGINWDDYPDFFKRGTFVQKKTVRTKIPPDELKDLPPKHAARRNPDLEIERQVIKVIKMPPFATVSNRKEVIFEGHAPLIHPNYIVKEYLR
jgi:tRNA(His) 5'-end guanylyltransferase